MLHTIEKVGLRWLLRFRKLDMSQQEQRQALVDTFINAIYLYDDKVLITFNYKEGTETVTFGEAVKAEKSSDMSARDAPAFHFAGSGMLPGSGLGTGNPSCCCTDGNFNKKREGWTVPALLTYPDTRSRFYGSITLKVFSNLDAYASRRFRTVESPLICTCPAF